MSDPEPHPRESQAVVGAFLMRYLEDRENRDVQPLHVIHQADGAGGDTARQSDHQHV